MNKKTRRTKKNSKKKDMSKIIIPLIIILLFIYIVYKIIKLIALPTDMFTIENGSIIKEESSVGYIIRDEKIIEGNNTGAKIIQIKVEGEKAPKGSQVFRYSNINEDEINDKINQLNDKIQEALLR